MVFKKSLILIEVIFSIALFSIIATYSLNILFNLYEKKEITSFTTNKNILLETTRLFLLKYNNFDNIKYDNKKLYCNNNLLLNNVSQYNLNITNNIVNINICLDEDSICQSWYYEK